MIRRIHWFDVESLPLELVFSLEGSVLTRKRDEVTLILILYHVNPFFPFLKRETLFGFYYPSETTTDKGVYYF